MEQNNPIDGLDALDLLSGYPEGWPLGKTPPPYQAEEFVDLEGVGKGLHDSPSAKVQIARISLRQNLRQLREIIGDTEALQRHLNKLGLRFSVADIDRALRTFAKVFGLNADNPWTDIRFAEYGSQGGLTIIVPAIRHDDENVQPSPRQSLWRYEDAHTLFVEDFDPRTGPARKLTLMQMAQDLYAAGGRDLRQSVNAL